MFASLFLEKHMKNLFQTFKKYVEHSITLVQKLVSQNFVVIG